MRLIFFIEIEHFMEELGLSNESGSPRFRANDRNEIHDSHLS